jgi:hypothetical protein
MCERLVIENVDADLLEEQRKALSRAIDCSGAGRKADQKDLRLLGGLLNLLDAWSDERAGDP